MMAIEYRTIAPFQGDARAQQLSFGEDEIILVSESDSRKRKEGWGRGKLLSSNQSGFFPLSCVEPFMPGLIGTVPVVDEAPEIVIIEEFHPFEAPVLIVDEEECSSFRSALSPASSDLNGEKSDHGKKLLIEVRSSFQKAGSRISSAASMTGSRISSAASTAGSSISSMASAQSSASNSNPFMARKVDCPERKVDPAAVRESLRKVGTGLSTAARHKRERISCVASKTGSMISQAATSTGSFFSHGLQNAAKNSCNDDINEGVSDHQTQKQQQPVSNTTTTTKTGGGWFISMLGSQQSATPVVTTSITATETLPPPPAAAPSRIMQQVAGKFAPFKAAMDRSKGNIRQPSTCSGEEAIFAPVEGNIIQEDNLI